MGVGVATAIGGAVKSIAGAVGSWGEAKTERIKAATEKVVEVQKAKAEVKKEQMKAETEVFKTREGTRRALIKKNVRYLRWASFTILFMPLVMAALLLPFGQVALIGEYFDAIDQHIPEWWVQSIQAVIAFLWATGEIVNVGNDVAEMVLDSRRAKAEQARAEAHRETERAKAEAVRAEAEKQSAEKERQAAEKERARYTGRPGG